MKHNRRPIILVSMPWASASRPNIALGLLVAIARRRGFPCHARYLNLPLASQFDPPDLYEEFANSPKMFPLAEHLFAVDIFGRQALDSDRYLDDIYRATIDEDGEGGDRTGEPHDDPRSDPRDEARSEPRSDPRSDPRDEAATNPLRRLRDEMVPRFLDQCTASLLEQSPDVVGFGCSCAQLMPSLALARRIKERSPETTIIMGGSAVHDPMGVALAPLFRDVVDHFFTGEAEESFVSFLAAHRDGGALTSIPGITVDGLPTSPATVAGSLDGLPGFIISVLTSYYMFLKFAKLWEKKSGY